MRIRVFEKFLDAGIDVVNPHPHTSYSIVRKVPILVLEVLFQVSFHELFIVTGPTELSLHYSELFDEIAYKNTLDIVSVLRALPSLIQHRKSFLKVGFTFVTHIICEYFHICCQSLVHRTGEYRQSRHDEYCGRECEFHGGGRQVVNGLGYK